jgi:catechol 2,3-dioxygenase-like lactoylglutathione lyase family enzyme
LKKNSALEFAALQSSFFADTAPPIEVTRNTKHRLGLRLFFFKMERPMESSHPIQNRISHSVRFGRMAPCISVADIARAVAFYTTVFGFEKVFENGEPVGFVILEKEAAELHLSLDKKHKPTIQNLAHLMVDDASALYAHCEAHKVKIIKTMRDADFGLRCFVFADPDGNRIDVGQDL